MLDQTYIQNFIRQELETDCSHDDVTAALLGETGNRPGKAILKTRQEGIFSGSCLVQAFQQVFKGTVTFSATPLEGTHLKKGEILVTMTGPLSALLSLERTLLNFLGHTCGVATLTRKFVEAAANPKVKLLATRKTLPGLREVQLMAVHAGGGATHRRSLSDGILIKDNHVDLIGEEKLLQKAHQTRSPLHGIEIEVQNAESLKRVLASEFTPDVIMLDNFSVDEMKTAIQSIRAKDRRIRIEASGGISLETVAAIAQLDIDYFSVGQLTHSAPSLNLTLDFEK